MAATFIQTYDIGFAAGSGNREDLLNVVVSIEPWDSPCFTVSPKTTALHTTHDWLNDTLAATASGTAAAAVEGADFNATAFSTNARTRQTNITMIFRKDFAVSQSQRSARPAGISDEYAYQAGKGMKEIARNAEVCTFQAAASATGGTGTVRVWKGLQDFITTNNFHSDATAIGGAAGSTATACLLTEAAFNGALEQIFTSGGNPDSVYVTPRIKRRISSIFAGVTGSRQNLAAMDKSLTNSIDIYQSDFGKLKIVPDRWLPSGGTGTSVENNVFFLETPMVRYAFYRPIQHIPLPPNGDSARGMVLGEMTIEVGHQAALGRINGVRATIS